VRVQELSQTGRTSLAPPKLTMRRRARRVKRYVSRIVDQLALWCAAYLDPASLVLFPSSFAMMAWYVMTK